MPLLSTYWRFTNFPSMAISDPLVSAFSAKVAWRPQNTRLCHCVLVVHSPCSLRYRSLVASDTRARFLFSLSVFISGFLPKNPVSLTLFFNEAMIRKYEFVIQSMNDRRHC